MTRRDWWLGILLLTAALLFHAAVPRYEWTARGQVRLDNSMAAKVTKVGEWYWWAACATCGGAIPIIGPFLPNASIGGDVSAFVWRDVPCPKCQQRHDYRMADLEFLEVPPSN